jgi:hypothetical protein
MKYGPIETKLRKEHLDALKQTIAKVSKGKVEDSDITKSNHYEDGFEKYVLEGPWKAIWGIKSERLGIRVGMAKEWLVGAFVAVFNRIKWRVRDLGLKVWGVDAYQTNNMTGVVMPDGTMIKYGTWAYRTLWFLGRIRKP